MQELLGRHRERQILLEAFQSKEPEMVALFGRRRVGKTFLVRTVFSEQLDLEVTGVQNTTSKPQIENFHALLLELSNNEQSLPLAKNWFAAFRLLIKVLQNKHSESLVDSTIELDSLFKRVERK